MPRKFVPMTRKALIRRIVEDDILVNTNDRHYFQGLAGLLDKSIAGSFHGVLGELKVSLCEYVVIHFYPWLKFYFPLFQAHYHTLPYPKNLNQG